MSKLLVSKTKQSRITINRLAAVLKEEGISNKALASMLGYEQATISKWTTNTIQPPLSTFLRIALSINRDLKDFFVSTQGIDPDVKKTLLSELAAVAEQSKKHGKA